ncbi:YaiI/YqxD family protein [Solibacillus sp. FSL W8-0372]|uniref:YaiI/YqxD family protein n=1 Tax=Solibacillus sp. FSL W8-0372 TaxID=2921713 RepID=UPI0030CA90EA
MLHLLIDADACPVVDLALFISSQYEIEPILFCDTSHRIERENIKTIIVDKGPDSVDFKLLSVLKRGDIVITGDYGLAAMCIAKGGIVVNHNGKELTSDNIDQLLAYRFESAKIRRAGGRTKGPKKRTEENNLEFEHKFRQICERAIFHREE